MGFTIYDFSIYDCIWGFDDLPRVRHRCALRPTTGGSSSRSTGNGVGKTDEQELVPPYHLHFYTSTRPRPFPTTARRRRHNAARRRGRTPLATACAAHFVRGICRHYTLPPTFLHFYTAKAVPHDGEGAVATIATACAAHFVRGICRHVWAVATSATLPHFSPNQSPNGQMQSQIVNRKIANATASPSPCMAREGRACRDRCQLPVRGVSQSHARPKVWPRA